MIKSPKNSNYCATIVEIKNLIPLDNCDNVLHANIFGNLVVVPKTTPIGEIGIYFPPETQLSQSFLHTNNLYRKAEANKDTSKKGFFEDNGRVKCVKFRGHKSMGFYLPLSSLEVLFGNKFDKFKNELQIGVEFDELLGEKICEKYIVKKRNSTGTQAKKSKKPKISKIIDNQFKFHQDTLQLGKNIHLVNPNDIISITYKMHGTSFVSSKVLCKKPINCFMKMLKNCGVPIIDTHYDNVYSSRKVIKNEELNPKAEHYYDSDIWGLANKRVKDLLMDGMAVYGEIVGFLPNNSEIQSGYDYGCEEETFEIYIYRITFTNPKGQSFEFSAKQVQQWCFINGLKVVPELYYGPAVDFDITVTNDDNFHNSLLKAIGEKYLERDCWMCNNKVPAEGVVLRLERLDFEAYKHKSFAFYERETKLMDQGQNDIEEEQKEE